ncbi:MAG: DUF2889 domain-containing protein [Thermincola sp.]|jgi:1-aminocyclopropane-1-carboxylate deaminase/D-cysteine desulfhydrase-like pyridoxal-dependent ACC family enzyme|nr:DUF2889 domain-containing protein [Thermincola sp.]MDT3704191.1 DUF2889 domain-containing protein [Thermincola sp.]
MLLFQKHKSISVEQEDRIVKIDVHFKDYFHEMNSFITVNLDTKVILSAEAKMTAAPWDLCYEVLSKMEELVGLRIQKGINEQVQKILSGADGCVHLVELTNDTITTVVQLVDFHRMPKEMPYKEKMQKIKEINKGICHTYNSTERTPKLLSENTQSQI